MARIEFLPEVSSYIEDLVFQLYTLDYFTDITNAENYTLDIYDYIFEKLEHFPFKDVPIELKKFGNFYVTYNSSKNTTWYILFDKFENKYVVSYIFNNHIKYSKFFNV